MAEGGFVVAVVSYGGGYGGDGSRCVRSGDEDKNDDDGDENANEGNEEKERRRGRRI